MPQVSEITAQIKSFALEAGFDVAGIAPVRDFPELEHFPVWVAAGHAGEMKYLEARDEFGKLKRSSLQTVAPWARSVIVCAINYNTVQPYSTQFTEPERGWISRYAWGGEDYHGSVMRRLSEVEAKVLEMAPETQTRRYVDTGSLVERVYARYAGVGWVGKNTCIINQKKGSWLFLGVILTSLELTPDMPAPDRCGSCTRCIDACPTDAFVGPYQLDSNKCIAYHTIEKRGSIPEEMRDGLGRHVFGCDICQDVCPWNRKAPASTAPEFQPQAELVNPVLAWLSQISPTEFNHKFRGSPLKRSKRNGIRRNAIVAMGNSGNREFMPTLSKLIHDEDEVIAEHARWAENKLRTGNQELGTDISTAKSHDAK
jgi:epoxyqueuosine reductase